MSQLAASEGQPGNWEEPNFLMRRLETVRDQEYGWQEPDESRDSRLDLWETGGEIPPVHPTRYTDMPLDHSDIYCIYGLFSNISEPGFISIYVDFLDYLPTTICGILHISQKNSRYSLQASLVTRYCP